MAQKTVYICNGKDGVFSSTKKVDDGYQLAANESFEMPPRGLYEPKLVNGQWQGLTEEQLKAKYPERFPSAKPSPTVEAMNTLGQQLVQVKAESDKTSKSLEEKVEDLTQSVNMLGQMIAKAQTSQGGTK